MARRRSNLLLIPPAVAAVLLAARGPEPGGCYKQAFKRYQSCARVAIRSETRRTLALGQCERAHVRATRRCEGLGLERARRERMKRDP